VVLELFRVEVPRFRFDNVRGQLQHILRYFFIRNVFEIFAFFAHLIRISQGHPEKSFTARFERDDVLARGEDNPPKRHHAFLADRLANDRECLLADFAIRNEIVGAVEIQLVDFFLRHLSISIVRLLSMAMASSSSGSISIYCPLPTSYPLMMSDESTSSPVSASTLRYLMRLPVFLLI